MLPHVVQAAALACWLVAYAKDYELFCPIEKMYEGNASQAGPEGDRGRENPMRWLYFFFFLRQ